MSEYYDENGYNEPDMDEEAGRPDQEEYGNRPEHPEAEYGNRPEQPEEEYRRSPSQRAEEYRRSLAQREAESSYTSDGYRRRYEGGEESRDPYQQRPKNPYAYSSDDAESRYRARYSGNNGGGNKGGGHGKTVLAVIVAALLLGGLVGAGCWAIGSYVGKSGTAVSKIETEAPKETQIAPEAIPGAGEQQTQAATEGAAQAEQPSAAVQAESGSASAAEQGTASGSNAGTPSIAEAAPSAGATAAVKALDVTQVVDVAMPAVVAITTKSVYDNYNSGDFNPFYYYFYGYGGQGNNQPYEVTGAGSGIIIGDDGTELWVVTNNHVVEGADTLTVTFGDETTVDGYVKGTDVQNDLAVVGVKLENLSDTTKSSIASIRMGDSDTLKLGETVIAIGNALGLGQSVSTGVVSAVNREITTSNGNTLTTIQTDAAINPGNSGGALLDANGELIGINVAKDAETDVEGMGYAIPISSAKAIIEKLTTMEPRVAVSEDDYPYMGVQLNDVSATVAQAYNIPEGVMVYAVTDDSPAKAAGLLEQDVIVEFNGTKVSTYDALVNELQYCKGGDTVSIKVMRVENGSYQEKELSMTLGFKKDHQSSEQEQNGGQPGQQPGQQEQPNGGGFPGFKFGF